LGKIKAICISEKKGTPKKQVEDSEFIKGFGIKSDAHAGRWHRQVSLLAAEKIAEFKEKGAEIEYGAFGENLVVTGFDLKELPVGTRFQCNDVILEITQIGKECHTHCQIYHHMGDCIMPREGVFAEVIQGGKISIGDEMFMLKAEENRPFSAAIITLSDRGAAGIRIDESGPAIKEILAEKKYKIIEELLLPDEQKELEKELLRLADGRQVDLIITTGGTGLSKRDCTPEATLAVATKNVPGIAEAIRSYSLTITKRAMLSRGVSVLRNNTLIINLPGSPKAVKESLLYIIETLDHGLEILRGTAHECARK